MPAAMMVHSLCSRIRSKSDSVCGRLGRRRRPASVGPRISRVPQPLVSVVVATYNRPARLVALLESLRSQTLPSDAFEVVVVDNGSAAPTQELLAAASAGGELQLRVVRHTSTRGPAGARNAGWPVATAPLIAFTDDDCCADHRWLSAALEVHAAHPRSVIQGRTEPNPSELAEEGLFSRTVRVDGLGPQYETCNVFYPRAALQSLGGFVESFDPFPGGEDTDLAWRAIESGWKTVFAPEARVFHAVERIGPAGILRVASRWTPTVRVFADHPGTRSMLYRGRFWNVWHYLMWRSLFALLAPRWLRRLVLSRHLMDLRRRARAGGSGSWAVPLLIVHDLVECWAVARGARRYRTFVL
jgi:GT2 family glycosyltransferase